MKSARTYGAREGLICFKHIPDTANTQPANSTTVHTTRFHNPLTTHTLYFLLCNRRASCTFHHLSISASSSIGMRRFFALACSEEEEDRDALAEDAEAVEAVEAVASSINHTSSFG